jgi:general secretion pathway protein A
LIETTQEGALLRVLTPVLYQAHCLACHGEPAGVPDVSGFQKEGARTGDLAGAISIAIPLNQR